ncbi:MAG: 50S ribosomal protein L18e [Candidatus Thermoplasmatota archaeon]|nr:50S ribosomal protein L18e [Candidatus Thermoplasmatota archaeon]MCL5793755.1 50S ribosomal protein L18e [Candidatus Thermoplasmatota archaeon]
MDRRTIDFAPVIRCISMSVSAERKTSGPLKSIISGLLEVSRNSEAPFWRDIAERLVAGRRRYASVDVGKIERLVSDGDTVVVPGSVLAGGYLQKKVTISAFRASPAAIKKIELGGGSFKGLNELARENPKGTNIKIIR